MKIFTLGKIGNLGTKIIINEKRDELLNNFSTAFLNESIKKIDDSLNIDLKKYFNDKKFIKDNKIISFIKISKGGFLSALYKLCEETKKEDLTREKKDRILKGNVLGLNYYLLNVPIFQSTIEIANLYDINPYRLYTDNAYIVFSNADDIEGFTYIGDTTNDKKRIRLDIDTKTYLTKDYKDEIEKVIKGFKDYRI